MQVKQGQGFVQKRASKCIKVETGGKGGIELENTFQNIPLFEDILLLLQSMSHMVEILAQLIKFVVIERPNAGREIAGAELVSGIAESVQLLPEIVGKSGKGAY